MQIKQTIRHCARNSAIAAVVCTELIASSNCSSAAYELGKIENFEGTCDASAAVAIDKDHFVVASDENSVLRLFSSKVDKRKTGEPIYIGNLLGVNDNTETELEAATSSGDTTYWISSHARTRGGRLDGHRQFFFALQFRTEQGKTKAKLVGTPCKTLLAQIIAEPKLKQFQLEDLSAKTDETRAPKKGTSLNIEGLAANPNGGLLIGLRGPLINDKALLIHLTNPQDVLKGAKAIFAAPIFLDLEGRGVRSIEYIDSLKKYLIIGGKAKGNGPPSRLFEWDGKNSSKPMLLPYDFSDLNPEALVVQSGGVMILSDDGKRSLNQRDCKDLEKEGKPVYFRGRKLKF